MESLVAGPHGTASTAIKSLNKSKPVLEILDNRLTTNDGSFTISFFLRTVADASSGGLFEFVDSQHGTTTNSFQIQYSNETIIVTAANKVVGQYMLVQRKSTWTFLAFTFDSQTSDLAVFSKHGLAYSPIIQAFVSAGNTFNNGGIRIGYSTMVGTGLNPGDAVSCFSFYSTFLNWAQIKQLQEACRIVHGSPLAGTPKLPLTPIPSISNPPLTTVPQEGQFPWLGIVIRVDDGSLVCTVSILDEFWVLTLASCFNSNSENEYQIIVGIHDISIPNINTQNHEIAKIVKSGSNQKDIALVQLKTPIDFTSDYVNDAYLFDGDASKIQLHQPQFVSGWGINGRTSFVSKTLPRYVVGNILSDSHCSLSAVNSSMEYCFLSSTTDKNVPCSGDEGSPLMYQGVTKPEIGIGDRLVQVGLYYNRNDLCTLTSPAVFVDIHQFQHWITEQMSCSLPGSNYEPVKCPQ